jgi:hypothetical protein
MSSKCFETESSSPGRRLYIQVWYSVFEYILLSTKLPILMHVKRKNLKVKWSLYRPGVAQRVGRGTALLFHDRGTRREWVISSTPRPHVTPRKDPAPILQEAGWAPGPVWKGGKSRPHRASIPDRPALSQPLYRLSYPAHACKTYHTITVYKPSPWRWNLGFETCRRHKKLKK